MSGTVEVVEVAELQEGALFEPVPTDAISAIEARELTRQIRTGLEHSYTLIIAAWRGRAWLSMGYSSWDAYCQGEFGNLALQPPREERPAVVLSLRDAGMSVRAIVSATGLGRGTVAREVRAASPSFEAEDPTGVPNGTPETRQRVVGVDGKSYGASISTAEPEQDPGKSLFEDVPLSDELLALSPDEVGIGVLELAPAQPDRERRAVSRCLAGSADAPLSMVIRLAGEIALDPGALVVEEDADIAALSTLVTDASRGVLALSHLLGSIDSTVFSGDSTRVAAVTAAVTDAVGELSRFLDDVHAGRP